MGFMFVVEMTLPPVASALQKVAPLRPLAGSSTAAQEMKGNL